LGLATVHGIVLQSGGHIDVESEPGQGARFIVSFPAVEIEAGQTPDKADARPATGTETVLVVEDQDSVRELTAAFLEETGYRVVKAAEGEKALAESAVQNVDLLLTDVVMPKMSGTELAARLRSRQPSIKVLFMSGYSDEALAKRIAEMESAQLIQKPFALELLAAKVREVLQQT
jgi:CheY-like chemotaxis protein